MKIIYRGECEELYGREIEVPGHECEEHAVYRREQFTQTHGLDCGPYESWTEEWMECGICKEPIEESGNE